MATANEPTTTEAGVYEMPAEEYHADPVVGRSLSSHGARKLLACPARFKYDRDNYQIVRNADLDEGTAAHLAVLGAGDDRVKIVEAPDWRTKAAQAARDDAYAAGQTPILAHKWEEIRTTRVAAIRRHPLATALLSGGKPEQVLIWRDQATGVWCRAMADYLTPDWIVDYKTCESAKPETLRRVVADYGYHIQDAYYRDGTAALGLGDLPFFFVFQEKKAPFFVTVAQLSPDFLAAGQARANRAREMYRDCTEANVWPPYVPESEIVTIEPPRWLLTEE